MIVCPSCRNANDEEAQVCGRCGASLEPTMTGLMPRRAPSARPAIEIPPPKPPSKWPAISVLGLLIAVLAGAVSYLLFRPNPCEGTSFTSDNFGYCLTVPQGWTAEKAKIGGDAVVDQFSLPTQSATVLVEAVDLTQDMDLAAFAGSVRQKEEQAGLVPGPSEPAKIAGHDAQRWDIEQTGDSGVSYRVREVVVVKDGVGWRITLNDLAAAFADHEGQFEQMLETWRFR